MTAKMNLGTDAVSAAKSSRSPRFDAPPQQVGGLTLCDYADATAARERIFDEARILKSGNQVGGDIHRALAILAEQARVHGVPFHAGDLEKTNRIADWDR